MKMSLLNFLVIVSCMLGAAMPAHASLGVGDQAADFELLSQFNTYYRLFDYEGYIIIVDFSIFLCQDCRVEAVDLQNNYWIPYQDRDVMVFGLISQNESGGTPELDDLLDWAEQSGLTYPVLQETGPAGRTYGVSVYPTSFIIDRTMTIRFRTDGYNPDGMADTFAAVLNEDTPTPAGTTPPTPTPTAPPATPTPFYTATPSPTQNPNFHEVTLALELSKTYFRQGDSFLLTATFESQNPALTADFYTVLDVFGSYFFYPSWGVELDRESRTIDAGSSSLHALGPFTWPEVDGALGDLMFYAILTQPDNFTTISNLSYVSFGYGP